MQKVAVLSGKTFPSSQGKARLHFDPGIRRGDVAVRLDTTRHGLVLAGYSAPNVMNLKEMCSVKMARKISAAVGATIVLLLLIQLVPYGRNHTNPAVTAEPQWDSPRTRELFFRSCRDCHSNETRWPFYSTIAPASWLIQSDVSEGRERLNVSEWDRASGDAGSEAAEEVREGEMPPWFYLPAHPDARLTDAEKQELIKGLTATFANPASERRK